MKRILQFITISLLFFGLSACDSKEHKDVILRQLGKVKSFTNSGCKNQENVRSLITSFRAEQPIEKIVWRATANACLKLEHLNIKDYCERDDAFSITTSADGDKLVVLEEVEDKAKPRCYCLYNLGVELEGFELGKTYTLIFKKDKWVLAQINFTYTSDLSGSVIIKRNN